MKRSFLSHGVASTLICLAASAALPGGCASEVNTLEPADSAGTSVGGKSGGSKATGGASGKTSAFGGTDSVGGATTAGTANGGKAGTAPEGGAADSAGMGPSGGATAATDKCKVDADCMQVKDSCFVCELAGAAKDCVDKGAPKCDNGKLDPCEMCEVDDVRDCVALGTPGEFSGGKATCKATCDGWDTSSCSICGNGEREAGEACDGAAQSEGGAGGAGGAAGAGGAGPGSHTCADEQIADNPGKVLPCTDTCQYDTTLCSGCSKGVGKCLDGAPCTASACNGAECKLGTACNVNCGGGGITCSDVQCNHDATCDFTCNGSGHCSGLVCDTNSKCTLDCSGGGSSCDGTVCKSGATCAFDCHGSGSCKNLNCQPGADCDVTCDGGGSICSGQATCGAGKTCDFKCSNAGSCKDLQVTCEAGATCNFSCTSGGSICPKADCKAGSTCKFDCSNNGVCNAPTCASGVCTGN